MKNKCWIGIDNGVSGSVGIINGKEVRYIHTSIKRELNYTKVKKWLNRIDGILLFDILQYYKESSNLMVYIERPLVNPKMFNSTLSAIRALESTLIVLERLQYPYQYVDSKEWQKELLPSGLKGPELKEASLQVAKRLFPKIDFKGFDDGDGLLIAEFCRRKNK